MQRLNPRQPARRLKHSLPAALIAAASGTAWAADEPSPYYIGVTQSITHDSNVYRLSNGPSDNYGSTGLAQINGCRGETSELHQMQARVDYDLEYLRHWSLLLDLKILARTALRLVRDANTTAV